MTEAWSLGATVRACWKCPFEAQSDVTAIAAGSYHFLALKNDGSVVAWGDNNESQTDVPFEAQSGVRAIAAGAYHSVALKSNGMVVAWGQDTFGQASVPGEALSGVAGIAASMYFSLAVKSNGSVVGWGNNNYGQSATPAPAQSGVQAVAAGLFHSVALKTNGTVVAWGLNDYGQTDVPSDLGTVTAIAAGGNFSVALFSLIPPVITAPPVSLTVTGGQSAIFSVAATGFPLFYQWRKNGTNLDGETGASLSLPFVHTNHAGAYTVVVGNALASLTSAPPAVLTVEAFPGQVVAWGNNDHGQTVVPVEARSGVTAIAAGGSHTLALKHDGRVLVWGDNTESQLNVPVAAQSGVTAIAAGVIHSVALKNYGSVVSWGYPCCGGGCNPWRPEAAWWQLPPAIFTRPP